MAQRAEPRDARLIEAELGEDLPTLKRIIRLVRLRSESWTEVPAVREVFETVAVLRVAERLEENGLSRTQATREAAARLQIPEDTIRGRLRRWCQLSRNWGR